MEVRKDMCHLRGTTTCRPLFKRQTCEILAGNFNQARALTRPGDLRNGTSRSNYGTVQLSHDGKLGTMAAMMMLAVDQI